MRRVLYCDFKAFYRLNCLYIGTWFLSILMCIVLFFGIAYYQQQQLIQRQQLYGSYQGAFYQLDDMKVELLMNNQMIHHLSIASIEGQVFDNDVYLGNAGSYSDDSIMNIRLYKGRMPENKQDIVLEMSTLDQLKKSYDLQQDIQLTINNTKQTYTLVGITYNFSALHKTEQYQMVNILTYPQSTSQYNIYFMMKDEYQNSLKSFELFDEHFIINNYTYQQDRTYASLYIYIFIFALLSGLQMSYHFMQKKKPSLEIMKNLGLLLKDVIYLVCIETTLMFLCALLMNVLISVIISFVISFAVSYQTMFLIYGIFIVVYLCSCVMMIAMMSKTKKHKPMHKRKSYPLSLMTIYKIYFRRFFTQYVIKMVLVGLSLTISFTSLVQLYYQYDEYMFIHRMYPFAYSYGDLSMAYENKQSIYESEIKALTHVYGVKQVNTIAQSPYYSFSYDNEDSEYASFVKEVVLPYYTGQNQLQGSLYGISDSLFEEYKNLVQEGSINKEEFNNDIIILHVPSYYENNDSFMIESDGYLVNNTYHYKENNIRKGDQIIINGKTLIVGGIIYDNESSGYGLINRPYGVICNQRLYREITGLKTYQYVTVDIQENVNMEQVEAEISRIAMKEVTLNNQYNENQERLSQIYSSLLISFLLISMILISFKCIFKYLNRSYHMSMSYLYDIFHQLYATPAFIKQFIFLDNMILLIVGLTFAMIISMSYLMIYASHIVDHPTVSYVLHTYVYHIPIVLWVLVISINVYLYWSKKKE